MAAWPNTFVVGAAKAGTTSMHRYLGRHPDVHMSPVKEPHFFTRTWELEAEDLDEATEEYLELFEDGADRPIRGEASPSYLAHPPVAERIRGKVPDANIIVMLRDPVERAYSHFLFQERKNARFSDFLDSVLRDIGRYEVTPPEERLDAYFNGKLMLFGEMGCYADQVQRYIETFGRENVHVILLEHLKEDEIGELERLAEFLGVDPAPLTQIDAESHNAYRGPPNRFAKFLQTDPRVKAAARVLMPLKLRSWIGNNILIRPGDKPEMDPEARATLQQYYEPEIQRLEEILDRDLPELRASWEPAEPDASPTVSG